MKINFEEHSSGRFLFWQKDTTTQKQESAEEYLKYQRENLKSDNQGNVTRNYNDQNSINEALFEYADTDSNGEIDEKEYKTLLMKSVSDGAIGEEVYALVNGLTDKGALSTNDSKTINPDYTELVRVADLYSGLLDADRGIDKNNDGVLTKEEFNNSAALRLMTEPEVRQSLYANKDAKEKSEKIKIMSQLSSGIVGNICSSTDFKYTMNYLSGQYEMCYVPTVTLEPDYNSLINIADKYRKAIE